MKQTLLFIIIIITNLSPKQKDLWKLLVEFLDVQKKIKQKIIKWHEEVQEKLKQIRNDTK